MPETTAATFCATLVDEWVRAGLTDAVVAPGSRSTPLATALVADGRLRIHVHHDERSAAFLALGLGMATSRPAIVVTTSGTAAVELHPAVVEAHEARVPLLVCTADRPPELHGVGAPQTVDQQHLYGGAVRWFLDPGVPDVGMAGSWRSLASQAVSRAVSSPPGPVHLNLPFRDPLVGTAGALPDARPAGRPWHPPVARGEALPVETIDAVVTVIEGRRGVIVAAGDIGDPTGVHELANALGWPVIAEPRSGCRTPEPATVSHADAILRVPALAAALQPDVVVRLGSLPSSKVLAQWLAGMGAWQLAIEADGARYDPDRCLHALLAAPPGEAAAKLARRLTGGGATRPAPPELAGTPAESWAGAWAHADAVAAEAIASTLARHPEATEPAVARDLVRALPDGSTLVVSSSMPMRDVEWYAAPRDGLRVLANRGANGIDGVVSTAVGVALAAAGGGSGTGRSGPTALLIGDVAFLHDTNGLLGAARRGVDLTIVVVDNDGGGIFSFLPQSTALPPSQFETLFGTPHGVDLAGLAAAHGIGARTIDRQVDLAGAVAESAGLGGVNLLLVRTDRRANVAVHDEIHAAVAAALGAPSPT